MAAKKMTEGNSEGEATSMSRPRKRSFSIRGHRTSVSLEEPFWQALRDIASERGVSLAALVGDIDEQRKDSGLSTAVRLFVLDHYRRIAEAGEANVTQGEPKADGNTGTSKAQ